MAHWTDDRRLNIEQKRLDARQAEAREKMTSANKRDGGEVELLPLPEPPCRGAGWQPQYRESDMEAYARANVERALAESRAEVERHRKDSMDSSMDYIALRQRLDEAEARAERLAEALRWIAGDDTAKGCNDGMQEVEALKHRARAALEQEPQE